MPQMKRLLSSFLSFSRNERIGLVGLLSLMLLLIIVRSSMHLFVHPADNTKEEKELLTAWQQFKAGEQKEGKLHEERIVSATLFSFDPNTLDSEGFRKLGLKEKTTHMLLNWRNKGKHFYKKEDLKPLYTLTSEEYARLEPFITIKEEAPKSHPFNNHFQYQRPTVPAVVDLNRTDSATLVSLNGIGAKLAHKIITRRKELGGFVDHAQLMEVYQFPDTTFRMLKEKLRIDVAAIVPIKLNSCNLDQLKQHPYIGEKVGRNILLFREGVGRYTDVAQLKQVPLMNGEIYRKIAPYFIVE
jgi:competence protein ComEA